MVKERNYREKRRKAFFLQETKRVVQGGERKKLQRKKKKGVLSARNKESSARRRRRRRWRTRKFHQFMNMVAVAEVLNLNLDLMIPVFWEENTIYTGRWVSEVPPL